MESELKEKGKPDASAFRLMDFPKFDGYERKPKPESF